MLRRKRAALKNVRITLRKKRIEKQKLTKILIYIYICYIYIYAYTIVLYSYHPVILLQCAASLGRTWGPWASGPKVLRARCTWRSSQCPDGKMAGHCWLWHGWTEYHIIQWEQPVDVWFSDFACYCSCVTHHLYPAIAQSVCLFVYSLWEYVRGRSHMTCTPQKKHMSIPDWCVSGQGFSWPWISFLEILWGMNPRMTQSLQDQDSLAIA